MTPLPPAIVFDWDNTLIDNWAAIAAALNHTFEKFGRERWTLEQVKANCHLSARDNFPKWFGENWKSAYDHYYQRYGENHGEGLHALPGADELVRWLRERHIPAVIVSNKRGDYLRRQVSILGWKNFFAAAVGAQDAPRDKPARDPVDHALAQAKLAAHEDIWFVGDTEGDMQCAVASGCRPVLIGTASEAARLSVARVFPDCRNLHAFLYDIVNDRVA